MRLNIEHAKLDVNGRFIAFTEGQQHNQLNIDLFWAMWQNNVCYVYLQIMHWIYTHLIMKLGVFKLQLCALIWKAGDVIKMTSFSVITGRHVRRQFMINCFQLTHSRSQS
jgi:hypothetical protein